MLVAKTWPWWLQCMCSCTTMVYHAWLRYERTDQLTAVIYPLFCHRHFQLSAPFSNKTTRIHVFILFTVVHNFHDLNRMQHDAGKVIRNTILSAELTKIASDKGFTISDNQGSGNCMFYALSEQLELVKGIQISQVKLRQSIVTYLRNNSTMVSYCC